jgi:hypothetical protein
MSNSKPHHENLPGDYHGPIVCKNCDHVFDGHFCNNCGQSAHTHAVDWHYIWHEIPHSIWHLDRGILYTARQLLTRPGYAIREYLDGKRVQHYRPLAFAFLFGAISAFLYFNISLKSLTDFTEGFQKGLKDSMNENGTGSRMASQVQAEMNYLIKKYYATMIMVLIPLRAWLMYLFFRKRGLNYPQHVVANTFITGLEALVSVLLFPFLWLADDTPAFLIVSLGSSFVSGLVYSALAYVQLFKNENTKYWRIIVRSIFAVLVTYFVSIFSLSISLGTYLGIKHGAKMAKQAKAVTVPAATPTQPRP